MQADQTARYADKRARILAAAGSRLAQEGVQGLDLAQIAAEVGLRRSSLTYYFANVEDLAAAVLERRITGLRASAQAAAGLPAPAARLERLFAEEIAACFRWRDGAGLRPQQLGEIRALKAERRRALAIEYRALMADIARLIDHPSSMDGDPAHGGVIAAHLVLENLFWLPAWLGFYHAWEAERLGSEIVRLLLTGMVPGGQLPARPPVAVDMPHDSAAVSPDAYLRVATRLVCESGFRAASIDRIVNELNVTKGSFYHHIAMKDDLVEVCFERSFDRLAGLQKVSDGLGGSALDQLVLTLRSVVRAQFDADFPFLRSSALPGLESELRARVIERAQRSIRWFSSKASEAMRQGQMAASEPFIAAQMLYIAANAAYDLGRMLRDDRAADEGRYLEMMLCGILPQSRAKDAKAS